MLGYQNHKREEGQAEAWPFVDQAASLVAELAVPLLTLSLYAIPLYAVSALAGERFTLYDTQDKRVLTLERGMSGNYLVYDAKGKRVGTGYRRQDGTIAVVDKGQKRTGTMRN